MTASASQPEFKFAEFTSTERTDISPVQGYNGFDDIKSESHTVLIEAARFVAFIKLFKDMWHLMVGRPTRYF